MATALLTPLRYYYDIFLDLHSSCVQPEFESIKKEIGQLYLLYRVLYCTYVCIGLLHNSSCSHWGRYDTSTYFLAQPSHFRLGHSHSVTVEVDTKGNGHFI